MLMPINAIEKKILKWWTLGHVEVGLGFYPKN